MSIGQAFHPVFNRQHNNEDYVKEWLLKQKKSKSNRIQKQSKSQCIITLTPLK